MTIDSLHAAAAAAERQLEAAEIDVALARGDFEDALGALPDRDPRGASTRLLLAEVRASKFRREAHHAREALEFVRVALAARAPVQLPPSLMALPGGWVAGTAKGEARRRVG